MKKLTKILICFMLCVFGFGLVACGDPRTKEEKSFTYPTSGDQTYGNGGLAVRKGNYIYFVNGYNSVENISNKKDSYTLGSLMLMKLGSNGEIVTDDNGLIKDDYYITMHEKLCGYEATNLFIHGNYLYFVSPCLENESGDEVWAKERVVFNRIKLDKSSEVEEVYSSGVKYDNLEYQYYVDGGKLYILALEKGDSYYEDYGKDALIRVNASSKSSSVVATDVSEVLFADNANEIFFTKHSSSDEKYYLKQYKIADNEAINYNSFDKTFDIIAVENGKVFVSIAHDFGSSTDVYSSIIANKSGFQNVVWFTESYEVSVTPDGHVILVSGKEMKIVKDQDEFITIVDENTKYEEDETKTGVTEINIINFINGCVLFYDKDSDGSNLNLVSYSNALAGSDVKINTLTTISAIEEDYAYFDLDEEENLLYFYKKEGSNYYLNRIKVDYQSEETEEMVGVYLDDDIPTKEEVEEEEIEEE